MMHVDFEDPCEIVGFSIATDDVAMAANTLRDDEDGAKEGCICWEWKGSTLGVMMRSGELGVQRSCVQILVGVVMYGR